MYGLSKKARALEFPEKKEREKERKKPPDHLHFSSAGIAERKQSKKVHWSLWKTNEIKMNFSNKYPTLLAALPLLVVLLNCQTTESAGRNRQGKFCEYFYYRYLLSWNKVWLYVHCFLVTCILQLMSFKLWGEFHVILQTCTINCNNSDVWMGLTNLFKFTI